MFLVQLQCSDCDEEEMLSLHIVNGALPSVPVGSFLQNAKSGELGFAGNISTIDTIVLDITVSDSCSISHSVCVSVQAMSLILSLIPAYSVLPFQRIPPCSQTIVLNGTFLQGGFSNTSGGTISFVLCANTMYGNNLASNKPVEKL